MNRHDAPAMAALFDDGYRSEQPVHRGREFTGTGQVLANWTSIFMGVTDFTADLLRWADDGEWTWSEWRWSGTHTDGAPFAMAGVIFFRIVEGAISAGRLYMEPVDSEQEGIEDSNRALFRPPTS